MKDKYRNRHRLRAGAGDYYRRDFSFMTKDSIVIRVRPEIVNMFRTIRYMEADASQMIHLDNIDSETLRKVIEFCEYQQRLIERQANPNDHDFVDDQNDFDTFYFRDIENDFMIKILEAVDYLDINILNTYLKKNIALRMSDYWELLDLSKTNFAASLMNDQQCNEYITQQSLLFGGLVNYIPVLNRAARIP